MKLTVYAETQYIGSRDTEDIEVPDEELEGLEGMERDKVIEEYAKDALWNLVEWGWYNTEEGQ